jgi:1-acyl-sn-glycerol-3-phosphate acyltransferase
MNLWIYPLLLLVTGGGILSTPVLLVFYMLRYRWNVARTVRHIIWLYGRIWLLIISPFVDFKREGLSSEQVPENCVFVINHLSFFDTYFMGALPHSDITFAVRTWPFKMFWYRLFMRLAQYLEVEDLSWQQTLAQGTAILEGGGAVLFFPEGHRSRSGKLQRFYAGAFHLAVGSGRPIVPLCITGTDILLPPGRRYLKPAQVRLRILPSVDVSTYGDEIGHRRLLKDVKAQMTAALDDMKNGQHGQHGQNGQHGQHGQNENPGEIA